MPAPASPSAAVILSAPGGRLPLSRLFSRRRWLAFGLALRRSRLRLRRPRQLVAATRAAHVLVTALLLCTAVTSRWLGLSRIGAGLHRRGFSALLEALLEQRQRLEYLRIVHRIAQQPFLAALLQVATRPLGWVAPLTRRQRHHIGEGRDALGGATTRQIADALGRRTDLGRRELFVDATTVQLDRDGLADDVDRYHLAGAVGRLHPGAPPRQLSLDLEILLVLIGEAAQQPAAYTADFAGVQRQILVFCHLN